MDRMVSLQRRRIDLAVAEPFVLGDARIDPGAHEAILAGRRERIQPQTMKVLVALHDRRGEVVGRDELVERCWDGRIVGEDVINRCIAVLRRFAQRAGGFRIETVPKAGYRLIESDTGAKRRIPAVAALLTLFLIAAIGFAALRSRGGDEPGDPPVPTIAILPLEQAGGDAAVQEFAAQTRNHLSHMLSEGGFPIRLASSGSAEQKSGADIIVSGEARRQGESFQATIRVETQEPRIVIYSQQFDAAGADSPILPERIGAQVAATLSWTGALMILDPRYQTNSAVLADLFKNTTLLVHGGDVLQAYEISRRLAPRAPGQPMAQLSLAFNTGFALEGLPLDQRPAAVAAARRAAERAVVLAPHFGDVYATWCFLHSPVRLRECEDRLRYAMRRDPDAPFVSFFLSGQLDSVGRFEEALELARQSLSNDRYKLWKIARMLRALDSTGRTAEADQLYRQANRWWPSHPGLIGNRLVGMLTAGDVEKIERFEGELGESLALAQRTRPELLAAIRRGDAGALDRSCTIQASRVRHLCFVGMAMLGDHDRAFAIAETLYPRLRGRSRADEEALWINHAGSAPLAFLSSPATASLRRDRRFLELARRTGLLNYWSNGRLPDFCGKSPEPVCKALRTRAVAGGDTRAESDPFTKFSLAANQPPARSVQPTE